MRKTEKFKAGGLRLKPPHPGRRGSGPPRSERAKAFAEPDLQKIMLEAEGVEVQAENRVDMKRFGWKNTYEDAIWLRERFEEMGI